MNSKNEAQKEILESLKNPVHGLLNLSPRIGKTKIGIDIIKKEKPKKILWVTPNTKLRDIDIPKEFIQWKAKTYLRKTKVICWASLSNQKGNYDMVVFDEYQDITINNSKPFFDGSITYKTIVGLSGTHPKHEDKHDIYKKLNLKILISMSIDEAVKRNLIAPYEIIVIDCRLDSINKIIEAGNKKKRFKNTEEKHYNYLTRIINAKLYSGQMIPKFYYLNRMRFIYNLKSKNDFAKRFIKNLKGRTLIFTGGIPQAEAISKHTFHSKTDDSDLKDFMSGKIKTLACVNAGGVGFTFKNVDNFVITQVNSNKKGDATQKIARSLVLQEGYKAKIYILSTLNTVDEKWKDKVLEDFDKKNVKHVSWKNYE